MTTNTTESHTGNGPRLSTAEPRGWGRRQFIADLQFVMPEDGGQAVLVTDPVEGDGSDTQISYIVQRVTVETGSNQPPYLLGFYEQRPDSEWDEFPTRICGLFPPLPEMVEKAKKRNLNLPFVGGEPQDAKFLDFDDPNNRRYEIWKGVDPDGKTIKGSKLYMRMRRTAQELPQITSEEEFFSL